MLARCAGTHAISVLMMQQDDLSTADIVERCSAKVTVAQIQAFISALVKRGHAVKTDSNPSRWSLTSTGRKAIDLVVTARRGLDGPAKTVETIARKAIASSRIQATDLVPFPRRALRLLASAALASAKPLDPQLRLVCELAIKEAA